MSNSYLHEKYELHGWLSPQQLAEGVDKQVEGEQAELNQQHQRVVAGLERLRPEGWAPGRTVVPRWIQGCTALVHTHYIETSIHAHSSLDRLGVSVRPSNGSTLISQMQVRCE